MYQLTDTFNNSIISQHRTLYNAVRADLKHARAVARNNPPGSYVPTRILRDGESLKEREEDERFDIQSHLEGY